MQCSLIFSYRCCLHLTIWREAVPSVLTVLAFVLIVLAARHACRTRAGCNLQCGLPSARALPGRGPQLGTMIDESTPVVDDDPTGAGAEHFSSPVAYLVHRPLRSRNVRGCRPFDVPCDWRVSFPSASLPKASILTGRNPGRATERSREARLRGEPRFERYLCKRQFAG